MTQASEREHYLLDTLLTVFVIHQLVVFYWRGVWEIFDVHVSPDDHTTSALVSLIIAIGLQSFVCLLSAVANFLCRSSARPKVVRWALEVVVFFFANLVAVSLWRAVWLLLDELVLPDNPGVSAGMTHAIGIVVLWLMLCAHSLTGSGCTIDGDFSAEEACLTPNYYLRLFLAKPPEPSRTQPAEFANANELRVYTVWSTDSIQTSDTTSTTLDTGEPTASNVVEFKLKFSNLKLIALPLHSQ